MTDEVHEVGRKVVYEGDVFRLERRTIRTAAGTFERDLVVHPGAVVLIPIVGDDVWLVRQWRHPLGWLLELPAGTLEVGEEPAECAKRELREEVGSRPESIEPLGTTYAAPGYSTERLYFFLCRGLTRDPLPPDADERLEVVRLPLEEAIRRVRRGEVEDTKTALGILLASMTRSVMPAGGRA